MQSDLPHTLFKRDKSGGGKTPSKNTKASEKVIRLQEEANRKSLERRRKNGEFTMDELFKK